MKAKNPPNADDVFTLGAIIGILSVMKKNISSPASAIAWPIKYVPVDDLIFLRFQTRIDSTLPTRPMMTKIVPKYELVMKCIFSAVAMSNSSAKGAEVGGEGVESFVNTILEGIVSGKVKRCSWNKNAKLKIHFLITFGHVYTLNAFLSRSKSFGWKTSISVNVYSLFLFVLQLASSNFQVLAMSALFFLRSFTFVFVYLHCTLSGLLVCTDWCWCVYDTVLCTHSNYSLTLHKLKL